MSFCSSVTASAGVMRTFDCLNRRFSAAWKAINGSVFVLVVVASVAAVDVLVLIVLELVSDGCHLIVSEAVFVSNLAIFEVSLAIGTSVVEAVFWGFRSGAASLESELMNAVGIPVSFDFRNAEGLLVVTDLDGQSSRIVRQTSGITSTDSVVELVDSDVALIAADDIATFIISRNAWSFVLFVAVGALAGFFANTEESLFIGGIVDNTTFLAEELVIQHE